jgi:NADPH:quinone reductase-like Zn-dependent oxidoreductase
MHAQVIRPERFGEPKDAFKLEEVETPADLKPREALVMVMAAGINYNNVWAARGVPVNVIKAREKEGDTTGFHIAGACLGDRIRGGQPVTTSSRRQGGDPLRDVGRDSGT